MMFPRARALATGLVLAAAALACAASPAAATAIEDLQLGDLWYGPPITPDGLKGRVVVVEFWGFN